MSISPSSRVLVVPPDAESLDSISELGLTIGSRSCQHGERVHDQVLIATARLVQRQPSCKAGVEQLQILCQPHKLQGYPLRRSKAT
ncbi:BQ5605_C035g11409 [Microbotryum silenes-dioicae]|uniref:BQ5605_C035g11409 protein n=1 Tax=Microbotryum silenes-dioicae TaxID=796604 RepID=A0A2X0MFZ4_9BASI|nr:BQ5605_C035g11409 [Microbotryum silenes-dioicae]